MRELKLKGKRILQNKNVAPSRVRELKQIIDCVAKGNQSSHPHECVNWNFYTTLKMIRYYGRTLTGAWIETKDWWLPDGRSVVAPSRVRELKLFWQSLLLHFQSRTLTGAWIETYYFNKLEKTKSRTLTGAWIETDLENRWEELIQSHPHGCVNWNLW